MNSVSLGVGKALTEAREAQGLALADVAQQLKFMPRQIESLEAERFEALPGPTIARGMVRTYARFLKLDPEPLLQRMTGRVDSPDATPQLAARFSQPVPFSDNGRRSTLVYLALSAGVLAIAGGVFYEWRQDRPAPEAVAAATAPAETPLAAAETPHVPAEAPHAQAVQAQTPKAAALPPVPAAEPAAKPAVPPASVLAAKDSGAPKTVKDATAPKSVGPNRLVLRFDEDAWAEVTDATGRQLVSSLNAAGTERVVRGTPPYNIVIGNAQHVKVSFNNREVDMQPYVRVEVARFTLK